MRLVFITGCLVRPPQGTERTQEAAEHLRGSALTIYCTNVAICSHQKNAVCMRSPFPVSELIWLLPQITPVVVFGCPK